MTMFNMLQRPPTSYFPDERLGKQGEVRPRKDDEETDGTRCCNLPKVRVGIIK